MVPNHTCLASGEIQAAYEGLGNKARVNASQYWYD